LFFFVDLCSIAWMIKGFKSESVRNRYEGYMVPKGGGVCERISLPSSADEFFTKYQKPCKPVVIHVDGGFKSLGWKTDLWNKDYLALKAGHVYVGLEKKTFGSESIIWTNGQSCRIVLS